MWSGTTIPDGWTLCDGSGDTPDLTDRFVVGSGSGYSVGDTGGTDSVQLSVEEIPSHSHSEQVRSGPSSDHGAGGGYEDLTTQQTGETGGDQPHENRPPFYALAFIMKT